MFIDGDKAVSGSYSFTWMSSRLDRNLITVTTGQAVDAFDQVFRYLYVTSSFVDLRQVTTDPEPEPDTRHQVLSVAPPSAAVARKLYNPKYALVALSSPSPVNSNSNVGPKEPEVSEEPKNKKKQKRTREDPPQDAPSIHPGLLGLEKACLLSYLPTWPEPDPPSDVIGFINVRDSKKPTQVHLQRSEMFEISQAIKFSSPISKPQETLPEVAKPRNRNAQSESKTDGLLVDKAKPEKKSVGLIDNNNEEMAPGKNSPLHRQKLNFDKSESQILQKQKKLCSDSDSGPVSLIPQALPQSSIKALTPKNEQPSHKVQITSTTSSLSESLKESKCVKEPEIATVSQTQSTFVDGTKTLKSNTAQKSQLHNQTQLNTEGHNIVSHQESHTNAANTQIKISSEETCEFQNTDSPRHIETSSACPKQSESLLSKNTLVTITTVASTIATSSCNSTPSTSLPLTLPPSTSSFPKLPLLPSSASSFTSSDTPDSKLCSEQLLKQDSVNSNTETTPDIVVVEKSKTSLGPQIITDVSALTSLVQTSPVKNLESGPDLHRNSVSKTGHPKQTENTNIPQDTKQETKTSKNASNQESHGYAADTQLKISSEETCNLQNVGRPGHIATSSASPAQSQSSLSKNFVTITAVPSTTGTSSCNSAHSTSSLSTNSPSTSFPELPLLPSSASSFTSSVAPDSMPCSDQLLKQGRVNDSTETNPGSSVDKRYKTSSGSQFITDASVLTSLVQTTPVKNLESGPDMQRNSVSKTKYPKQTENTNIPQDAKQETQTVTSQNVSNQESHCNAADTQLKISTVETRSVQNLGSPGYIATSSASPAQSQSSLSKNNLVTITAVASTTGTSSCNSAPSTNSLSTNPPSTSFPELPLLPSSASSSTSSVAPDSKPCSDQLLKQDRVNDSTETTPGISVDNRSKTSSGPQIITDVSSLTSLVQTSPVKNLETGPDLQRNSVSKTGCPKQTENTNIPGDAKQETRAVNSQNASNQESHSNTADTQLKISSEKTCNPPNPGSLGYIATSSASPIQSESSLSKNNLVTITAVASTTGTSSCNSTPSTNSLLIDPPSTSSFPELPLLPSSASSFTSSVAPDSKPCSDQLFKQDRVNDSTETTPGISVDKRSKTSSGPQIINDVSALTSLVQTSPVKNLESGPDLRGSSVSKTKYPKQTENTNIPEDTKQETQTVTSQKRKGKETDRKHNDRAEVHSVTETQLETKSDVSAKDSSSTAIVNINELIPKSVDSKTHRYCIATSSNSTSDKTLTNLECAKATNTQTYLARCHEPQIISYSNFTIDDVNKAQPLETSTAPTNWISHNTYILKENHDGSINSAANALSQPGKQAQVPSVDGTIITLNSVKQHTHNTFLEQACITQGGAYTSRKTLNLPFSNVQAMDLSLQTNKQESQLPVADVQSSAPKVSPPNLPTTDSQTTSPDLQTPTTDISDDYLSSREDSTTSEEYFECSESPSHEPVLGTSGCCSYGTGKNSSPNNSDCHFSRNVGTSSADLDNISSVSGLTNSSHSTSSSESSILSWTSREPPTSLLGTKGQNRESNITTRRNSKEGAKNEVSSSNTEKKKERVHQSMEGTNSKELNRMPRSLKRESDLKEMALKLSKASGGQVEGATTDGESVQKETKRLSTGELKPERVLSEGKKSLSSKDKPTNEAALTPGHMEIRQRQSTRETTGQKVWKSQMLHFLIRSFVSLERI
uniref:Mucin-5AC-like n=1 Tax=Xiphophorus maculatus TaxID=8083 RepID=A0A3B5QZD5_XIPMA